MRRQRKDGSWSVDQLKELKRGDEVYLTSWGRTYVKTIVKRVRTVECATIVTVEKREGVDSVRFVGFHTGQKAIGGGYKCVLTLDRSWAESVEEALQDADKHSQDIIKRAEALKALSTLKNWLFYKEQSWHSEVE